jgi:ATP-dependent Zn protease
LGRFSKSSFFPILLVILLITLVSLVLANSGQGDELSFNDFEAAVEAGSVKEVVVKIKDRVVEGVRTQPQPETRFSIGYS